MTGIVTQKRRLKTSIPGHNPETGKITYTYQNAGIAGFQTGSYSFPFLNQVTTSFRGRDDYGATNDVKSAYEMVLDNQLSNIAPYDTGHEFHSTKASFRATHRSFECRGLQGAYRKGPLLVPLGLSTEPSYSFGGMDLTKGSSALRATMPTKSAANLSQALLELVVDLPRIPYAALSSAKSPVGFLAKGSEEYINATFAWTPLVRDVLKTCQAIVRSTDILNQYARDAGRQVRRRFDFDEQTETISATVIGGRELDGFGYLSGRSASSLYASSSSAKGTVTITDTLYTKYWFSGAWMYHLFEGDSVLERMNYYAALAKHLLGVKLDVELMWQLTPWSWLVDWFANIGDIISINASIANDNLVLRYGYLMRDSAWKRTGTHSGVTFFSGPSAEITQSYQIYDKQRVRSTPYGFGLNTAAFTTQQWAILGALGLSKAPNKMMWG